MIAIDKKKTKKRNGIYCDLPDTFPLDEFTFKSHS